MTFSDGHGEWPPQQATRGAVLSAKLLARFHRVIVFQKLITLTLTVALAYNPLTSSTSDLFLEKL